MDKLEQLLYLGGVASEYLNYSGERTVIARELRLQCLAAMGFDTGDEEAVGAAVYELDAGPWRSWLRPFNIASRGDTEYLDIRIHQAERETSFAWEVLTEAGERQQGTLVPAQLPEVGEYHIDGIRYSAHRLSLQNLPPGYHLAALSDGLRRVEAELVVAPQRCYEAQLGGSQKLWGVSCQLYTLRSSRNWGIGDFSDLEELVTHSAEAGMDMVGLNPLHAPHMAGADFASPYSPSDRRFLNPLYIDPERVPDFSDNPVLVNEFESPQFQDRLATLRAQNFVDYDAVAALKLPVLEAMFLRFRRHGPDTKSERAAEFEQFLREGGSSLADFAQHEAGHSGMAIESAGEPRFHQYLQWLAREQLRRCQALAVDLGMQPGLMGDLAVGAVRDGAEVASAADLYCAGAVIGAPPDPFTSEGQNWNLPALNPVALHRDNYRHFIELLRANMSCCGALRIDHVMGLMRLWWCLPGVAGGCYVYYPVETLLALLRLESHRNQCIIIGEDMGVVPDELRRLMTEAALYSSKVLYFETTAEQNFKAPRDHQVDALLMVTNHDVATLAGWWNGSDLRLREEFGLRDGATTLHEALRERREQKDRLLAWLSAENSLPSQWAEVESNRERLFDMALCGAILRTSARSASRMMLFQLDDLQLIEEPVNIPGTYREYPNWRRKQKLETSELFEHDQTQSLLASIYRERLQ